MTEQTVADLVTRLLRAIDDDDAPDYRALLEQLLDDANARDALARDEVLCGRLMPELRKLRPLALWVRDRAELALGVKRVFGLDGAICQIATSEDTPAAVGRECWLEVPATEADARVGRLLPGWGLLVSGEHRGTSLAALRRRAPLCAMGIAVAAPLTSVPSDRLDLVLVEPSLAPGAARFDESARTARSSIPGARILWSAVPPEAHALLAASGQNVGLTCRADEALCWVLRLAMTRSPRSG